MKSWFTAEGVIGDPGARVIGGASRCGDRQRRGVAVVGGSALGRRSVAASVAANANAAVPIDAAATANALSPDAVAVATADQDSALQQALAAWPEAEVAYQPLSGAMKRAMARHVADAKQPETRARRAVEMAEKPARAGHPFRALK